jgi:hypothetical protein
MAGRDAGAGAQPGEPSVPSAVLRSWDEAEARLFPLVMAQPDLYQQALGVIQRMLERLRETCQDLPALLAAHHRGGDLIADLASEPTAEIPAVPGVPGVSGVPRVPGVRPDLVAAAACAMRYRELVALMAAEGRLAALARAREQGLRWAVAEESGQADRAPYVPYQRIEAEAESGRALIVSIGPDETLSRAVYRLDAGQIDLASGALRIGDLVGSYLDPDELAAALLQARGGPAGAPD